MEFPLLSLNSTLLEKVINKMKGKSYISLQQTCHNMAEFIQNSRNISVLFDDYIELQLENGNLFQLFTQGQTNTIDIKSLYGIRLDLLTLPAGTALGFSNLYNSLKNYQISCDRVVISDGKWTTEQYAKLFNLLKRTVINLEGQTSNAVEALVQMKDVERVQVHSSVYCRIERDAIVSIVKRLLSSFRSISVRVDECRKDEIQPFYPILRMLCTGQFPNLRHFNYFGSWSFDDAWYYGEEMEKIISESGVKATPLNKHHLNNGNPVLIEITQRDGIPVRIERLLNDDGDDSSHNMYRNYTITCRYL